MFAAILCGVLTAISFPAFALLASARAIANFARPRRVRISHIQPQRSVISQNSPHFAEDSDHVRDVLFRRALEAKLPLNPIVSQPPVRRRGHHTMHGLIRQRRQNFAHIAVKNRDPVHRALTNLCGPRPLHCSGSGKGSTAASARFAKAGVLSASAISPITSSSSSFSTSD